MSGLALHTTTGELGLAIADCRGNYRFQTWHLGHDTSNFLHLLLQEFIVPQSWQDFRWLAVAKGPGSFTGTRLGVVTARTLAQQLDLPLFGISTLGAIAWSNRTDYSVMAVEMPAQRGQQFGAVYQVDNRGLIAKITDQLFTPEAWQNLLAQNPYPLLSSSPHLGETVLSVLELADLAWQQGQRPSWTEVLPFYGQHPVQ